MSDFIYNDLGIFDRNNVEMREQRIRLLISSRIKKMFPYSGGTNEGELKLYESEFEKRVEDKYNAYLDKHRVALEKYVDRLFRNMVNIDGCKKLKLDKRPLPEDLELMIAYLQKNGFNASYVFIPIPEVFSITTESERTCFEHYLILSESRE